MEALPMNILWELAIFIVVIVLTLRQLPDAVSYVWKPVQYPTPLGIKRLQEYLRSLYFSVHQIYGLDREMLRQNISGAKQSLCPISDIRLSSSGERQSII